MKLTLPLVVLLPASVSVSPAAYRGFSAFIDGGDIFFPRVLGRIHAVIWAR